MFTDAYNSINIEMIEYLIQTLHNLLFDIIIDIDKMPAFISMIPTFHKFKKITIATPRISLQDFFN